MIPVLSSSCLLSLRCDLQVLSCLLFLLIPPPPSSSSFLLCNWDCSSCVCGWVYLFCVTGSVGLLPRLYSGSPLCASCISDRVGPSVLQQHSSFYGGPRSSKCFSHVGRWNRNTAPSQANKTACRERRASLAWFFSTWLEGIDKADDVNQAADKNSWNIVELIRALVL